MHRCDPDVFRRGYLLADLIVPASPLPDATVDRLCQALTAASEGTVRFDWHPLAGIPLLLYLGDYDAAKRTYLEQGQLIRDAAEAHYKAWHDANPDMAEYRVAGWKSNLGTEKTIKAKWTINAYQFENDHVSCCPSVGSGPQ